MMSLIHTLFLLLLSCKTCHLHQDSLGREVRQYNNMDDDSFIGLMGKRSVGLTADLPLKRDMSDVFVGLFGRRNADSDLTEWNREIRGFRKKPRLM
ncbi:tachykinin-3b [Tachysurus vachellii]|uniref:tachykinin-3b n=1 Tax=Tachysurus vachellii TaxID=175792 RepID=UPI00296B0D96|nr:tachykinin-3b [Tachysurus vachellii]